MILAPQATPALPVPLLPAIAAVPATQVPCPCGSDVSELLS
jgi:hypothetical protein